ncbi:MAG: hypothetical protein WD360_04390 [Nitriliruptoraceae bacterium]
MPGNDLSGEHGSVVVTLALSVTMLMVVIALVSQTLFSLLSHTLIVREVNRIADVAAHRESLGCPWFSNAVTTRFSHVDVACDETPERLVAVVTRSGDMRLSAHQGIQVMIHRDQ